MQGILTKLKSENNNLRTNSITGEFDDLPMIGKGFIIVGEPLTIGANVRMIMTSDVESINKINNSLYEFKTLYSTYKLEII